ncbi:hypothetical protein CC85DRAFT_285751 [Cutaneotrichosporon oleaginosum]|uniref:Uncharacterized protein n=1 Tax=Cutaneotrichosporon oleaginosum TaxID=879819 RepID=A0A0J1B3E5_9TREE|nr:uncharacterized protein CC85DRAFT_285751 [Cutaneotrichosporon oleaginosum]KLT42159.1 hypothetical protein CC85DRAFT_285751 [Cutaneotrichosporon oleaginosum]TXT11717.1 hypothetical protein COLE_02127 [Cutaneotrichosporon oleaginosum]
MPSLDPIQVTVAGSAACLGVYVILTALVVYNSKKCAYCDQRLVVCNYLIALCSFRLVIFALRIATATMGTWGIVPFWISYVLMPGATFCLAESGAQLVFDWHWHGVAPGDIPRSQRLGWAVPRHLLLSVALVLGMFNIVTRNYIPLGYLAAGIWWFAAAAMAVGSVWIWVCRRRTDPVGVGALLFAWAFTIALSAQAVFVLFLALGRFRQPAEALAAFPLLERGVVTLNVVPDLLVLLPAVSLDMRDLDALRGFRFAWHETSGVAACEPHETHEMRRRRTPPPPPDGYERRREV